LTVSQPRRQADPMSTETMPPKKKLPIAKLAIAAGILAVAALIALRSIGVAGVMSLIDQGVALIRDMGPWVFFTAMTILPAFGLPMLAFTIPAGQAFAPQMGMGGVIAASLVAIAVNLALTYWIARYALRPMLTSLITRYGYNVPRVTKENALSVLLVVRLTPGPPYALQCFVLGLAEAPFKLYMIVSWLAILPYALGAIVLGEGLFKGNFKAVLMGIGVVVVASVALGWLRKKYFARET
jgi:uncharacterized membrane protein YdjX (TVP38/TMEM64 family)